MYYKEWVASKAVRATFAPLAIIFEHKYYLDWLYEDFFATRLFQNGWNRLMELNDKYVIDGVANGSAQLARAAQPSGPFHPKRRIANLRPRHRCRRHHPSGRRIRGEPVVRRAAWS